MSAKMNLADLVAIDVHTHAEVSSRDPQDTMVNPFEAAASKYFKDGGRRPTIPEIAAYYRERRVACVVFPVDMERAVGVRRVSNEEVAELAHENGDVMIPFASVDPLRGKMGAREVRKLVRDYHVRGFKFHPQVQDFAPNDRRCYAVYEAIAETGLPSIFHTGHSGMGTGMPGGGGIRLNTATPCMSTTWRWIFPACRSSSPIHPGHGRTRRYRSACTSPRSILISPAGRRNTSRRSLCSMPTASSNIRFCSARTTL